MRRIFTSRRVFASLCVIALIVARYDVPRVESAFAVGGKVHDSVSFEDPDVFSHTVASGEDLLVLCMSLRDNATNIVSATFNGDALSKAVEINGTVDDLGTEIWYMVNPDVGTFSVSIDLSTFDALGVTAANFSGVDTSDPLDTFNSAEGDSADVTVAVTPSAANALVVDCMITEDGSAPTENGANQTTLFATDEGVWASGSSYVIQTSAVEETMAWTIGSDTWVTSTAVFNVATGGGGSPAVTAPQPIPISFF